MTITTPAEGRANSPNSGMGTVTELAAEPTPPSMNRVMLLPLRKSTRRRIRWSTETLTPVFFEHWKDCLSPPLVNESTEQMGFGDSPLVSVIANAIRRVVLPPEERSNEAIQLPAGTVSAEVAGSVKKQAKEPVVNGIPIPPPLPFVVLSVFAPKQSSGLIIESTLRK